MKLIDFAFTSHFSPAFLQEIFPGNFLFLHEILNFTLRQFLHGTRNMCFYLYKHCTCIAYKYIVMILSFGTDSKKCRPKSDSYRSILIRVYTAIPQTLVPLFYGKTSLISIVTSATCLGVRKFIFLDTYRNSQLCTKY